MPTENLPSDFFSSPGKYSVDAQGNVFNIGSTTVVGKAEGTNLPSIRGVGGNITTPYVDTPFSLGKKQVNVLSSDKAQETINADTTTIDQLAVQATTLSEQAKRDAEELRKREEEQIKEQLALEERMIGETFGKQKGERESLVLEQQRSAEILFGDSLYTTTAAQADLNTLSRQTQDDIFRLERVRDGAINQARRAAQEKDIKSLREAKETARNATKELIDKQTQFVNQRLAAQQEARQVAQLKLSEAGRKRDDARAAIQQALTQFGGAGIEGMDPETKKFLEEQAVIAGFGPGYLEGSFRTLKEKATEQQRELAEARLKDKQQQDLFMNFIRTSQLATDALRASISAGKKDGGGTLGTLSGKYSTDYLASRAQEFIDPTTFAIDWQGVDRLENVDRNLWSDMNTFLNSVQQQQAKAVEEAGTAPEDKDTGSRFSKTPAGFVFGALANPTPSSIAAGTEAGKKALSISQPLLTKGLEWLFG